LVFNAVSTSAKAQASNYRFCTIEPNTALVNVPDEPSIVAALGETQSHRAHPNRNCGYCRPGTCASKGEGLGNKFLANIAK